MSEHTEGAAGRLRARGDDVLRNPRELVALGGTVRDRAAASRVLRKTSPGTAVIVKHPGGTGAYTLSGSHAEEKFYAHAPVPKTEFRGDVGAGDAVAAGYLTTLARDRTSAIRRGAHLARTRRTGDLAQPPALANDLGSGPAVDGHLLSVAHPLPAHAPRPTADVPARQRPAHPRRPAFTRARRGTSTRPHRVPGPPITLCRWPRFGAGADLCTSGRWSQC